MATITARYAGKCGGCGAAVAAGSTIEWAGRITGCSACGTGKAITGTRSAPAVRSGYVAGRAPRRAGGCTACGEKVQGWSQGAAQGLCHDCV